MASVQIVSGEGTGEGTVETYNGKLTCRAIRARLTRERAGGDRWAYVKVDGERVSESELTSYFSK